MTQLYMHTDAGGVDALVRLQGLVSAIDASPKGYDRDELLIDLGEIACEFTHAVNTWRPVQRKNMPAIHELKFAVIRNLKDSGIEETKKLLNQWLQVTDTPAVQEALE